MSSFFLFVIAVFLNIILCAASDCKRYYDKPIDVCFSSNSLSNGLLSYRYECSYDVSDFHSIYLHTFNNSNDCSTNMIKSSLIYNSTNNTALNPSVSCIGSSACAYFRSRMRMNQNCNETGEYYEDELFVIDICTFSNNQSSPYLMRKCNVDKYGNAQSIFTQFYANDSCNTPIIKESVLHNDQCSNLSIMECQYPFSDTNAIEYGDEYLFYEFDLIASWIIFIFCLLMLCVYSIYIVSALRTVKNKAQYQESGIFVLDDKFSTSRLSILLFQWFALLCFVINALFLLLNAWSIVEFENENQCQLVMSSIDLSWHYGKGCIYLSLMARIMLIFDGLPSKKYKIPTKITKVFAVNILIYFLLSPILDLIASRAEHKLYFFMDERLQNEPVFVCGEIIKPWVSALFFLSDLVLCSMTIGVYLYSVGQLIIEPIANQKVIDICIRYAIFCIFCSVFIMIGNAIWCTNSFGIGRYIDTFFIVLSLMFMLRVCSSCYIQCCSNCHKRLRSSYINNFIDVKHKYLKNEYKERRNNPLYVLKTYDKTFDAKLTQLLSAKNLRANESMDRYHQNVAIHHANATIKSKKKLAKLKKTLSFSSHHDEQTSVALNDRDIETMQQLLTFGMNKKFKKQIEDESESKSNTENVYLKGQSKKKININQNRGLFAHLNPTQTNIPQSVAIAIHSSVIETVKADKDNASLTEEQQIAQQIDEYESKIDICYDENIILFPRRSPTIFPNIAYMLTKSEKFALRQREDQYKDDEDEYSKSYDHSSSLDSEDESANLNEMKWPKAARKLGNTLDDVMFELNDLSDKDLLVIWDYFDKDKRKRLNYKNDLIQLLAALFLLYFKKRVYGNFNAQRNDDYIAMNEQPPSFKEIEPLLIILSKYIRDNLRKKKKKCLKKSDFVKNIKKYLQFAIDKRAKSLKNRESKLRQTVSIATGSTPTANDEYFELNDGGVNGGNITEYEVEDEEEKYLQLLDKEAITTTTTTKDNNNLLKVSNAAQIELQQRMKNYIPRTSDNRYRMSLIDNDESDGKEEEEPIKMKIDVGMEKLQKKRESQRLIFSSSTKESMIKTSIVLSAIHDNEEEEEKEVKSPSIHANNDTEILHEDAFVPKAQKVVVVHENDIKDEVYDDEEKKHEVLESMGSGTLKDFENLLGDVRDDKEEDDNESENKEHGTTDTIVQHNVMDITKDNTATKVGINVGSVNDSAFDINDAMMMYDALDQVHSTQTTATKVARIEVQSPSDFSMDIDDALEKFHSTQLTPMDKAQSPSVASPSSDYRMDSGMMDDVMNDMAEIESD